MSEYKFKTVKIRNKNYVEVKERVKYFRQEKKYNGWSITTEFPMVDSEQCICKAEIAAPDGTVIASGHAHEVQANGNINKTSYIENCETSAIGRALAVMGIGVDDSMASANEVADAIAQQEAVPTTTKKTATKRSKAPTNIMDSAVGFIKSQTDKQKAYDSIVSKYGDQLTEKQKEGLMKFVR